MDEPFGEAIKDFFEKGEAADLIVNTNYTEHETIPVAYLFRTETEMTQIELTALRMCKGKVLDVSAAAGCHTLILQEMGFDVTVLEKSGNAAETIKKRGINQVVCNDINTFSNQKFDTILLLMNGIGIAGDIEGLSKLLLNLKTLLNINGQILLNSSDIKYLFEEDDGSLWVDLANPKYYGEMEYEVIYKKYVAKFKWLFVDFETLNKTARNAGLNCILIEKGDDFEYLAKLTLE